MVQINVLEGEFVAESFMDCKMVVFLHNKEVEGLEAYLRR